MLPYRDYADMISLVITLFAAVTTPELLCPDRRDRVLTLYFSTALTRGQYVFGKVLAAIVPLLLLTLVPMWFLYAGNVLFAVHPWATSRITRATRCGSRSAASPWRSGSGCSGSRWPR